MPADSDTDPLTDVEYDNQPADSDAGGETPGSSLAAAGTSSQKRTLEITPPPAKKPKKQVRYFKGQVLTAVWKCSVLLLCCMHVLSVSVPNCCGDVLNVCAPNCCGDVLNVCAPQTAVVMS